MNSEKAREFFSAYFEGSLDQGLKLALEQKFKSDLELKQDYDAFAAAFADLDSLRDEDIEIPIFLSDRIATRLEEARQQKRKPFAIWNFGWLRAAPSGLAVIAVVGAALGIAATGAITQGSLFGFSFGGHDKQVDQPTFKVDGSNVKLVFQAHGNHTVVIKSGTTGDVLRTLKLDDSQPVEPKLNNDTSSAKLFSIQEDNGPVEFVVVPGKASAQSQPTGEGTLGDFALATSNYFQVPILMENVKIDTKLKWSLEGVDSSKSANSNLQQAHLSADLRADGMMSINGH